MVSNYLTFLALCLAGLMIRTSYELLKKAGRANAKSTIIFAGFDCYSPYQAQALDG